MHVDPLQQAWSTFPATILTWVALSTWSRFAGSHSCQVSWNGWDSPGIWPHVPIMSRIAWFCSIVPEYSSIAQMGVWHKHKVSILSNFGPYISIFSGRGCWRSPPSGRGRPKVGVARNLSRAFYFLLCPRLSSHKLDNYGFIAHLLWIIMNTAPRKTVVDPGFVEGGGVLW
jgi:hypothetical protein